MVTEEQIEDASDQAEVAVRTLRQAIRDRDNHFAELDCLIGSQAHRIKGMNKCIKELEQKVVELLTVRDWLNERNTKLAEEVKQHEDNYNHEQLCRRRCGSDCRDCGRRQRRAGQHGGAARRHAGAYRYDGRETGAAEHAGQYADHNEPPDNSPLALVLTNDRAQGFRSLSASS